MPGIYMIRHYISELIMNPGPYPSCIDVIRDCGGDKCYCLQSNHLPQTVNAYLIELDLPNGHPVFAQMAARADVVLLPPSGDLTAVEVFLQARGFAPKGGLDTDREKDIIQWVTGQRNLVSEIYNRGI